MERGSDSVVWLTLNLLEGEPIQMPVPKTHYAENPMWARDTSVFATSKTKKYQKSECGQADEAETEMMNSRCIFSQVWCKQKTDSEPCPRCFLELILLVGIYFFGKLLKQYSEKRLKQSWALETKHKSLSNKQMKEGSSAKSDSIKNSTPLEINSII